jgi:hypothetical protein
MEKLTDKVSIEIKDLEALEQPDLYQAFSYLIGKTARRVNNKEITTAFKSALNDWKL